MPANNLGTLLFYSLHPRRPGQGAHVGFADVLAAMKRLLRRGILYLGMWWDAVAGWVD